MLALQLYGNQKAKIVKILKNVRFLENKVKIR